MKLETLLVINAVVAVVFGIAFVIVPGLVIPLYGAEATAPVKYTGQLFGAALVGFAVLAWAARKAAESEARRAIVLAFAVSFVVGLVVSLIGQLRGVVNALGWSTVIIYLFFTLGYGYFQFARRPEQQP